MKLCAKLVTLALLLSLIFVSCSICDDDLPEVTVIVGYNKVKDDNYKRFLQSARVNNIKPIMIKPLNGKIHRYLLLKQIQNLPEKNLVLYSSLPDIVFTEPIELIRSHFLETNTSILFAGDKNCSTPKYEDKFVRVVGHGLKYLNANFLIGTVRAVKEILQEETASDDQTYYTEKFLNKQQQEETKMKIDHYCEVFQWIDGTDTQLSYDKEKNKYSILNDIYWTEAPVLMSKGAPGHVLLNRYTDYLNGAKNKKIKLTKLKKPLPTITFAVMILHRTPFVDQFWLKINQQSYPKEQINLIVISRVEQLQEFDESQYASVQVIKNTESNLTKAEMFELGLTEAKKLNDSFYFCLESSVHLDNPETLYHLVSLNKTIVSPMISRANEMWSNFWGDIDSNGFYKRAFDYFDIVNRNITGIWNVPYMSSVYLIKNAVLPQLSYEFKEHWFNLGDEFADDSDLTFCNNIRRSGLHMLVSNLEVYGHLIHLVENEKDSADDVFEFYELQRNPVDWAKIYIHPNYYLYLNGSLENDEPCQDVYRFQMVTDKFCDDVINIMESYGKWSNGKNKDERLDTGYENVPTRDIHLRQVGLSLHWDEFLDRFVKPLQRKVYEGYYNTPPKATMKFVVRYRADEQPSLRPHNDASTYTISIALNKGNGIDFEGGGVKFNRYDCSITDTEKGSMLMHPGRLTHQHEGLATTNGTRYILVTFIDP